MKGYVMKGRLNGTNIAALAVAMGVILLLCALSANHSGKPKSISEDQPLSDKFRYSNNMQKFYAWGGYRIPEGWDYAPGVVIVMGSAAARIQSVDEQCSFIFNWNSVEPPLGTALEKTAEIFKEQLARAHETTVENPEACTARGTQPAYLLRFPVNASKAFRHHDLPDKESDAYLLLTELPEEGQLLKGESMLGEASEDLNLQGLYALREGYFPPEIFGFQCIILEGDFDRILSAFHKIVDSFVRLRK